MSKEWILTAVRDDHDEFLYRLEDTNLFKIKQREQISSKSVDDILKISNPDHRIWTPIGEELFTHNDKIDEEMKYYQKLDQSEECIWVNGNKIEFKEEDFTSGDNTLLSSHLI